MSSCACNINFKGSLGVFDYKLKAEMTCAEAVTLLKHLEVVYYDAGIAATKPVSYTCTNGFATYSTSSDETVAKAAKQIHRFITKT
jgi:hypothetical protein